VRGPLLDHTLEVEGMAVKATPADAAQAWSTGFSGASAKYVAGINSVTVSPGQLAANQKSAYLANVAASANIWAAKMAAMDLGTWKAAAANVGAARLATGATKGAPKMQQFMTNFLPQLAGIVSSLPARGTFEQNMQRSMAYATALHGKKGSF
jgi:hypothetical protein